MAKISILNKNLIINIQGTRKLWTLKNKLSIPLNNVTDVAADYEIWKNTPRFGQKRIGTDMYGLYFGGYFVQDGHKIFYDLRRNEGAIVISLKDEKFDKLIIGVENPDETVKFIQNSI